jgi:hypothetical protein
MANLCVQPHLCFYPEDAGRSMSKYWHTKHWHKSANPDLVTPLAIINGYHFFVYKPCLLADGCAIIPYCWFVCGKSIIAHTWPLRPIHGVGWIIEEFGTILVSQDELLAPFGSWAISHLADSLPDTTHIISMSSYLIQSHLIYARRLCARTKWQH